MFQCYCEETIDDGFLDFSIFKENSETKYTDHCLQLKLKKKKTKYLYSSKKEMTQWDLFLNKAILSSILQFNHYRNALMERGIILETNMITHMATL